MKELSCFCVKWGTKYTAEHVNKLFASVSQYTSEHYRIRYYCVTEDPTGIDSYITILPLPQDNDLVKWWNKMYLWDSNVVRVSGEKVFFDLDLVIQHNIDLILDYDPEDCLCVIRTYWHDMVQMYKDTRHVPFRYTELNSSVIRWNDRLNTQEITRYFQANKKAALWYYRGIDNFFGHRNVCRIKFFPIGWAYSFNNGYIHPHDTERHVYRDLPLVCIFDSMGAGHEAKF
jgi:hypothetical protein